MTELDSLPVDAGIRECHTEARLRIGDRWETGPDLFAVTDPATGRQIGSAPEATAEQVRSAIDSAQTAFEDWRRLAPDDRARHLRRWHEAMVDRSSVLSALLTAETGKPLVEAQGEVAYATEFVLWFAEEARRRYGSTLPGGATSARIQLLPQPLGVVGAITPWNYPVVLVVRKIGAALAAGCTAVLKPSELTPLTAYALVLLAEEAGLPAGVLNLVTATDPTPIAEAFVDDRRVRKISFTGSVAVGRKLMEKAARTLTRVGLELGGHNPFIVLPDADAVAAAEAAATARLRNGGQTCVSANRIYVHRDIEDAFFEAFLKTMTSRVVGDGFDAVSQIGPLIHRPAAERLQAAVDEATMRGAELYCGGAALDFGGCLNGAFYPPTVVRGVPAQSRLAVEEVFGPVAAVATYSEVEEAAALANDSDYGLAAYVFTESLRSASRLSEDLQAGMVVVNQAGASGVHAPQGGIKQSGIGLEGGAAGVDEFSYQKYVSIGL